MQHIVRSISKPQMLKHEAGTCLARSLLPIDGQAPQHGPAHHYSVRTQC